MDFGAVEQGDEGVALLHEQADFGAAEDDGLCAAFGQGGDGVQVAAFAVFTDLAGAQFVKNDAVDFGLFGFVGDEGADAAFGQPVGVEAVLHGEARAEQADGGAALCAGGLGDGVENMQEGDADGVGNGGGDFVHGVGGEQDALRAGVLQGARGLGEDFARLLPIAAFLAVGNVLEFDAVQQQGRAVVAAFDLVDAPVDVQVIGSSAFGRHAADNAECVHGVSFGWERVQAAFIPSPSVSRVPHPTPALWQRRDVPCGVSCRPRVPHLRAALAPA